MLRPARISTLPTTHLLAHVTSLLTVFPSCSLKVVFDDAMEIIEATEEATEETSVEPGETVEEALKDFLADF